MAETASWVRRTPTEPQIRAAALCVWEACGYQCLRDARNAVLETHAALDDDWRAPYWALTGAR